MRKKLRCALVRTLFLFLFLFLFSTSSSPAHAQVHADAGLQVGAMKRVLTDDVGAATGFGPVAQVHGHVALLPMLRLGGYFSYDLAPVSGAPARHFRSFGARVKITPPWPRGDLRLSFVTGGGYVLAYAPSYHQEVTMPGSRNDFLVDGASGGFVEIPVAVAAAYKLRRPLELTAELGGRIGFGHSGPMYRELTGRAPSGATVGFAPFGNDTLALYLAVGLQLDL